MTGTQCLGLRFKYCLPYLQNHRGWTSAEQKWVFGMLDTTHTPALGYMEMIPSRDVMKLLPSIQHHVHHGTKIHSDEWAAYKNVQKLVTTAQHQTAESVATGANTQNHTGIGLEPSLKGKCWACIYVAWTSQQNIASYIAKFMLWYRLWYPA